jgi:hypothetical protein
MDYFYVFHGEHIGYVPFNHYICRKNEWGEFYFVGAADRAFEQEKQDLLFPIAGS